MPPKQCQKRIKTPNFSRLLVVVVIVLWIHNFIGLVLENDSKESLAQIQEPPKPQLSSNLLNNKLNTGGFKHFSQIAQELAALEPTETLQRLEKEDPFGTQKFNSQLLEHETALGRVLLIEEIKELFPCPISEERITLPVMNLKQKARDFRNNKKGTFLFFQHLRKAGGTNFCTLAEKNLPRKAQPRHYCMPDKGWYRPGGNKAGSLHFWSNDMIISKMTSSGFKIAVNEWENFDPPRHFELPAVFATSFRKPLDRALSQFRFECMENRGCIIKDIRKWWDRRADLSNVYTKTFADLPIGARRYFKGKNNANKRREFMSKAINTLSKFHIVLVMEWLVYGAPQIKSVLGFNDVTALTTRVRPHIGQAKRDDGQEKNSLGSASIKKASWIPEEYLDKTQYKKMSEDLALDEILTEVARRMFLERVVCEDMSAGIAIR